MRFFRIESRHRTRTTLDLTHPATPGPPALHGGRVKPELASFYRGLLAAEARHHGIYCELACQLAGEPEVRTRLAALADWEAEVIASAPLLPRMHS